MIKIIYRISDAGYSKAKLPYINNENCLKNALHTFPVQTHNWLIIADNISEETDKMIQKYITKDHIQYVSIGNGAGTFNLALDEALQYNNSDIVYFIENDYMHRQNSNKIMLEGFNLGVDFLTLYDHLDKYFDGPNPYVHQGGEDTKVFLTNNCHWKFTNSTTMTFAAKVSSLKKYESTFRQFTSTTHPYDFDMWISLRNQGASLISPIPGYSTHGDLPTVAPLIDWEKELIK